MIFASRSDLLILKTIKQSVEMRNSVCHSATIYANAIMHAGTTVDTFLRENLVSHTFVLFILHVSPLVYTCFYHGFMCIFIIHAQPFMAFISSQDWLSRATNWAKFSATAGLGVIHRGHLQQGR